MLAATAAPAPAVGDGGINARTSAFESCVDLTETPRGVACDIPFKNNAAHFDLIGANQPIQRDEGLGADREPASRAASAEECAGGFRYSPTISAAFLSRSGSFDAK